MGLTAFLLPYRKQWATDRYRVGLQERSHRCFRSLYFVLKPGIIHETSPLIRRTRAKTCPHIASAGLGFKS